jgi:hypothetical protein
VESSSTKVETVHGLVAAVGLGSRRRCGDRGVGDGAALRDFGVTLRHGPPNVFRRRPGVKPGRPRVRLTNAKGPFGQKPAPPRAILREGGPFGAVCAHFTEGLGSWSAHARFEVYQHVIAVSLVSSHGGVVNEGPGECPMALRVVGRGLGCEHDPRFNS